MTVEVGPERNAQGKMADECLVEWGTAARHLCMPPFTGQTAGQCRCSFRAWAADLRREGKHSALLRKPSCPGYHTNGSPSLSISWPSGSHGLELEGAHQRNWAEWMNWTLWQGRAVNQRCGAVQRFRT